MNEQMIAAIGIILIFAGIFMVMASSALGSGKASAKIAVGGFIGPVPFGFANDRQMLYVAVALSIIMLAAYLLFMFSQKPA